MSPRTCTAALDDRSYWRRLLATVHPDREDGAHELFVFLSALREHVEECGGGSVSKLHSSRRREADGDRLLYDSSLGYVDEFVTLTLRALSVGQHVEEPYRWVLGHLIDCDATDHGRKAERQCRGASYKQLAAIGHKFGMSRAERCRWYEVARSIPLSDQHAHHILSKLQRQAA